MGLKAVLRKNCQLRFHRDVERVEQRAQIPGPGVETKLHLTGLKALIEPSDWVCGWPDTIFDGGMLRSDQRLGELRMRRRDGPAGESDGEKSSKHSRMR